MNDTIKKPKPKYTPFNKVIVKEKQYTKMEHLLLFIKDPLTILAALWLSVTISDINIYFSILSYIVVIVGGLYTMYRKMKSNGDWNKFFKNTPKK